MFFYRKKLRKFPPILNVADAFDLDRQQIASDWKKVGLDLQTVYTKLEEIERREEKRAEGRDFVR